MAFIKGDHVFVADNDGTNVRQVDHDPRGKGKLWWDTARKRLSYLINPEHGEMAHMVVVDLEGHQLFDRLVRPRSKPPVGYMRFVEDMWWLPNGKAQLFGSIGPSNCEQFDLDIATMEESNIQYGYCSGIVPSPDDKHTAEISPVNQFTIEERRFQILLLDNENLYRGEKKGNKYPGLFILAGPVWSPDSQYIAILEKRADDGEAAVTLVTLEGAYSRIPVAASVLDHPELAWVGSKVVTGQQGVDEMQIDSVTKQVSGVTADTSDELDRCTNRKQSVEARANQIKALVEKLGGREGVELNETQK